MLKNLMFIVAGAVGMLALVIACSDDTPADADAAACDCEPAEPPLAGRIVRLEDRTTVSTVVAEAAVRCPDGAMVLGGGCYTDGVIASLRLWDSGSAEGDALNWACGWLNPNMEEVTVVAWANCLLPAPAP